MAAIFTEFVERLVDLTEQMESAIAGLSIEALDWVPGPGMNSINILVTHTAGATRYWIGDMAGQDPSARKRPTEFKAAGRSAEELRELLRQTLAHSQAVLAELTWADTEELRPSVAHSDQSYRVAWCLLHALEHMAVHVGHVQLTRQLWEQQKGA